MDLEHFCLMVSLAMALAMLLLVCNGVAGCRCLSSSNAIQNGQIACTLRNNAPSYASAMLATTCFMIWHKTWIGPLSGGGLSSAVGGFVDLELRKQYLAAWDLPLGAVK